MTTPLDSYLHGPYKEDGAFLKRLTNTIHEVIPIFYNYKADLPFEDKNDATVSTWPYGLSIDENEKGEVKQRGSFFSASTHCMILFALDSFESRPRDGYSLLLGKGFRANGLLDKPVDTIKLQEVIAGAKKGLLDVLKSHAGKPHLVTSGTYGNNDPFTLTWLAELAFRWGPVAPQEFAAFNEFKERITSVVDEVLSRERNILDTEDIRFSEVTSSFLKLRRLHLAKAAKRLEANDSVGKWIEKRKPDLWKDFDDTIHRQLSYSSMRDAKFDPAELALAFEGALLLHPTWIGRYTIDEVFAALTLSRDRHPYWRPITPFLANDQGHVLFLISIEVANSILRACEILDEDNASLTRFSQIESQLRAYAVWLLGEVEEIADADQNKPNLVGWRTEYEDKRNTIQLWHTSHVLVFLAHYASLLKRKIAADGIEAAGLQVRAQKEHAEYWKDEPLPSLVKTGGEPYAVLAKIERDYIISRKGRDEGREAPRSILLYGPPGTGKTTLAEELAARLGRPLITVTVSDFLATGAAGIENRAKGVFEVLGAQEEVVILFDEIDQFLLDRNSAFYKRQSDVFKFMTPGMLTKLQDLRDAEGCLFIVATNYYERIDSAIKRRGRIDDRLLLNLPDQERRSKLLTRFVVKLFPGPKNGVEKLKYEADVERALEEQGLHRKTVLLGYGDLKNFVDSARKVNGVNDLSSLINALTKAPKVDAAVSLSSYSSRFEGKGSFPFEEFFLLLYLLAEVGGVISPADRTTIYRMLEKIPNFEQDQLKNLLEDKHVKDNAVCNKVEEYLTDIIPDWKTHSDGTGKK